MRGLHRSPTDPHPPATSSCVQRRSVAVASPASGRPPPRSSSRDGPFSSSREPPSPSRRARSRRPGPNGLQDLLNWTLYGGAIACAGTAMFGFAKMGISHSQQSFQGANHGKSVAILGLLGALGLGLTPTIVNGLTAIH